MNEGRSPLSLNVCIMCLTALLITGAIMYQCQSVMKEFQWASMGNAPIRTNRFTGETQRFNVNTGWTPTGSSTPTP